MMSMLLVPRSMTLVTAPVRRFMWKRSDRLWRWREDIFGQPPRRILPDAFEHDIAQIVEQHPAKARTCISRDQRDGDGDAAFHARHHPVDGLAIKPSHAKLYKLGHDHQQSAKTMRTRSPV